MDFEYYFKLYDEEYGFSDRELSGFKIGFEAGQQSKQAEIEHRTQVSAELAGELIRKRAEIDALQAKIQELWTELDDRQSKEYIIEKCESIIKELLK